MDVGKILSDLRAQHAKLEQTIATLKAILQESGGNVIGLDGGGGLVDSQEKKRRGRKFMDTDERREVSQRMKRYWDSRRKQKAEAALGQTPEPKPEASPDGA